MEFDGFAPDGATFQADLGGLRSVSVDAWLTALPASAVTPVRRAEAVDQMLRDIPVPPGLDLTRLRTREAVRDRYQLGAEVTGAVACAWFARWGAATRAGDTAALVPIDAALQSSKHWAILKEMEAPGDWPEVLWEYVDVATGHERPPVGGTPLAYLAGITDGLGCPAAP